MPLTFIAFLTDPEPIAQILVHMGEPSSPPLHHPPRGPPKTEPGIELSFGKQEGVAQKRLPGSLDQTPHGDPAEPDRIPH